MANNYCHKCKEFDPKRSSLCELSLHGKQNPKLDGADTICFFDYSKYYEDYKEK